MILKIRKKFEQVNRKLKIFRICKETYRGKGDSDLRRVKLVASLVNHRLLSSSRMCLLEYHAEIDCSSGGVFYKTNTVIPPLGRKPRYYECFFLIQKEKAQCFASLLSITDKWESSYDRGEVIDGYRWSITTVNSCERKIYGVNDKPDELDFIMTEVERLLEKDFTGRNMYQIKGD